VAQRIVIEVDERRLEWARVVEAFEHVEQLARRTAFCEAPSRPRTVCGARIDRTRQLAGKVLAAMLERKHEREIEEATIDHAIGRGGCRPPRPCRCARIVT